jgi:hypothetical protein
MASFGREEKDRFLDILRGIAKKCKAVMFLFVTEGWTVAEPNKDRILEWLRRNGDLSKFPGRGEAVFVSLEHQALGSKSVSWLAEITRDAESRGTLKPFTGGSGNAEGRFIGILPSVS